jgi:hypothetical protein
MQRPWFVLGLALALALAPGCTELPGGEDGADGGAPSDEDTYERCTTETFAAGDGEAALVECDANVEGSDEQAAECPRPSAANATASTDLREGAVRVTVEDAAGSVLVDERLEDTGGEARNLTLAEDGEPGTWTLTVERLDGFQGSHRAELWCPR